MSKRLEILEKSLEKKNTYFNDKLQAHFDTVKQSNGQPLNDKRNGAATLNKWEKQENQLRNIKKSIESTEKAIEREKDKIAHSNSVIGRLPKIIDDLLENKTIVQWRKYPNRFFVKGVEGARLIVNLDTQLVSYSHLDSIKDKEQYAIFRDVYNKINNEHNKVLTK